MRGLAVRLFRLFSVSMIIFGWANSVLAQDPLQSIVSKREFTRLSVENGLSNNLVTSIVQDSIGYLWIGTSDGLCRYGGNEFLVFRHDPTNDHSLINNSIHDIKYDGKRNKLWVATAGGLDILNLTSLRFDHLNWTEPMRANTSCSAVEPTSDGEWVALIGEGLLIKVGESDTTIFELTSSSGNRIGGLKDLIIRDHHAIVCNANKAFTYDMDLKKIKKQQPILTGKLNFLHKVQEDVLLSSGTGLFILHDSSGLFEKVVNPTLRDEDVVSVYQDSNHRLWVGTRESGLLLSSDRFSGFQDQESTFEIYQPRYDGTSVYGKTIQFIFEDSDHGIWLGTWSAGLNYVRMSAPNIYLIRHNPLVPDQETISHNRVWGLCYQNDRLWIGTDGGGLNSYDLKTGINKVYQHDRQSNALSDNAVLCGLSDSQGMLWFGTYKGGLNKFDPSSETFVSYQHQANQSGTLNRNDVRMLFEDSQSRIWVGTNGGGLQILDQENDRFYDVPNFEGKDIRSMLEDGNGGYWIAIYGSWFAYYKPSSNEFYRFGPKIIPELRGDRISYIDLVDGILWIGTRSHGVIRFDTADSSYETFDEMTGLVHNSVRALVVDNTGDLWISTDRGVSFLDTETHRFRNYGVSHGVQSGEFNVASVLKLDDKWIGFGGTGGLNILNTESLKTEEDKSKLLVSQITVFDRPITDLDENLSPLYSGDFKLSYDQNVLKFDFEVLRLPIGADESYYYMLEGSDQDWNIARKSSSVTYVNLEPDTYSLKLARPDSRNQPNEIKTLRFKIAPPIWKTSAAYVVYIMVAAMVLMVILWYYTQQIKLRSSLIYEKKIRTDENKLNKERFRFFTNFSHELRTPLTLILGPLKSIINQKQAAGSSDEQLELMYRNALRLSNLINKMLDFRKAQSDQMKLKYTKIDLAQLLNDILKNYKDHTRIRGINLSMADQKKEIPIWIDLEKFEIIMNNLLSNALKYTDRGGRVTVKVFDYESFVEVHVVDTGRGIPEKALESIFKWYYQVDHSKNVSGTGIGLALTQKLVELHGGQINANSALGEGSEFIFTLEKKEPDEEERSKETYQALKLEIPVEGEQNGTFLEAESIDEAEIKNKSRVLIVDDNPDIVKYIKNVLSGDYFVFSAIDGEKGILLAKEEIPDLIISDVMMPEKSGIDLCKILKADSRTSHIPIILLTAKHTVEDTVIGYAEGADSYMTKPFDEQVLLTRVKNLLQNRVLLRSYFQGTNGRLDQETHQETAEDVRSQRELEFLNKVQETILEQVINQGQEVGVYGLAKELGFSRASLYRKLKSVSGYTINEFIRKVRLKKANDLIVSGEMNVSEAAFYVGFSDMKYFREIFKKEFDRLPSDVKKEAPERYI